MSWGLAIDYGTSFTAAAVVSADGVEVLEVEDSRRFPSSVLLAEDESLLVGRGALNQARRFPDRFERSPKRLLGQPAALLGSRPVEVVEMVSAVLERVAEAARTRQGQAAPDWVRMTNPAGWGRERQDVLREAARRAGLGEVELLTEPEAAAWFFVQDRRGEEPVAEPGRCVAVYDLGGGTFDTAILRRSEEGFELAGPPGGLDWFGGEDFDQRLYDWVLGRLYELDVEAWRHLKEPDSAGWRRARLQLREDVRQAKEALSTMAHVSVPVSKGEEVLDVEVTRREFEELIQADLRRTVDILEKTARDANVTSDEIAAVYLTGGSSRVPMAAALASQFHPQTYTRPDPKTLVAGGALAKPNPRVQERPAPSAAPPAEPAPAPEPPKPLCRRAPRVSGKPVVGHRLNADTGKWARGTDLSIQWLRRKSERDAWSELPEAAASYEVLDTDVDHTFAVRVSATDGDRREEIESNAIGPVRARREPRRRSTPSAARQRRPASPVPAPAQPSSSISAKAGEAPTLEHKKKRARPTLAWLGIAVGVAILAIAMLLLTGEGSSESYNEAERVEQLRGALPDTLDRKTCEPLRQDDLPLFAGTRPVGLSAAIECLQDDVVYMSFGTLGELKRAYREAVDHLERVDACPGVKAQSWSGGAVACGRQPNSAEPVLLWSEEGSRPVLAAYSPLAERLTDLVPGWKARRMSDQET